MMMSEPVDSSNVILEFIKHGRYVKVTAIDVITREEVSLVGDARQTKDYLSKLAVKKLRRVQSKR